MVEGSDWDDQGHDQDRDQDRDQDQGLETIAGSPPSDPSAMTVNPMIGSQVHGVVTGREAEPDGGGEEEGDSGDEGEIEGHVEAHLDQSPALVGLYAGLVIIVGVEAPPCGACVRPVRRY